MHPSLARWLRPLLPTFALTLLAATLLRAQDGRDVGVFRRDAAPVGGKRLAVVVGLDDYASLRKLHFADRDADDVARELEAIGFAVMRMRLDGRDGVAKPLTATSILTQVEKMCRLAKGDGTVLFYFSGHGFEDAAGRTFLCPYETDVQKLALTGLDLEEVQNRLVASGVRQRLLIVDMCRNDPSKSAGDRGVQLQRFAKAQGTGLLFSTAPGSRSFEPEPGMKDEAGVVMQNGLFTHYLLRGLRGEADRGGQAKADGLLTFREVAYFVSEGLTKLSMKYAQCEQEPYLRWDGTAEDVLLRVLPEPVAAPVAAPAAQPTVQPAAQPQPVVPSKPEPVAARDVSSWAKVLRVDPDPSVVTDADARAKIVASGWPWRVEDKASGIVLLLVPPGEFTMGSPWDEEGRGEDEKQHRRRVTKPFYLGETEVTQKQWGQVMGDRPSKFTSAEGGGDWRNLPVEQVSWDAIQPFLQKTGLSLPSEAQWEYACRAGTTTTFSFGATLTAQQANFGGGQTVPVGALGKNAWGFADMHGNVWEWCADGYGPYPSDGATEAPAAGASRVLRGGSLNDFPAGCRAAGRYDLGPAIRGVSLGFRAARTL